MNTAKDRIKKLVDEIPETKAGEIIDFLLFLKGKSEHELQLTLEEDELWGAINMDERIPSSKVKEILLGD